MHLLFFLSMLHVPPSHPLHPLQQQLKIKILLLPHEREETIKSKLLKLRTILEKQFVFGGVDLCKLCFDRNESTCYSIHIIYDVQLHTQTAKRISHGNKYYVVTNKFLNVYSYKPTISKKAWSESHSCQLVTCFMLHTRKDIKFLWVLFV
jgi:hypothetical protein